jgi:hypothetical protein
MARRRLAPAPPEAGPAPAAVGGVPHAERAAPAGPLHDGPRGLDAPIARVAAEAAGAAAASELAETLRRARDDGRLLLDLPLDAIAADHLTRDRLPAEDAEMAALRASLRAHGQRTPIEVTPLAGALPYGLISGWRRLTALAALHTETGEARFATVRALVRRPETAAAAYVAMVEENELRVGLSQYERARVAALAAARGVFPDAEAALRALFAGASRPRRSRIRAFLAIHAALDDALRFPAHLPERLGLRLAEAVKAGQGGRIAAALAAADPADPAAERAALEGALARPKPARPAPVPLRPGVSAETRLGRGRLTLTLSGPGVGPELAAELAAALAALGRDGTPP